MYVCIYDHNEFETLKKDGVIIGFFFLVFSKGIFILYFYC